MTVNALSQMIRMSHLVEVSFSHTTVSVGREQSRLQLRKTLKKLRVPFFVNKHSTDTRHRASAVTMHVGEQVTVIKNGELARFREQNSPTDMSEC